MRRCRVARQARKVSPTGFYHVMMRGNNREMILAKKWQKERFLGLLSQADALEIAAYCLMDNHVHLVVRAELPELSEAVKKINIRYAMGYNRHGDRVGHVFQDRYRSEVILDDSHLLQAVRYVHSNPVKAGLAEGPEAYTWSSYGEYADGSAHIISPAVRETVLHHFVRQGSFRAFHDGEDLVDFADTQEDLEHNQGRVAQMVIDSFCRTKGVADAQEIYRSAERLEELVCELLQRTRLSHRRIAGLLGISASFVHRVSRDRESEVETV
jgi:putative transposase